MKNLTNIYIPQTFATYDYEEFGEIKGNRTATLRLVKSMKELDLTPFFPILVDEHFRIIDGQHRFLACKSLSKPIYYIVLSSEISPEQAMILSNQHQRTWHQENFLKYHAFTQGGCYKELYDFTQDSGLGVNAYLVFAEKQLNTTQIREGKYKFTKNCNADAIVDYLHHPNVAALSFNKSKHFILAVRKAFEKYTSKQLCKIRDNAMRIPECARFEQYMTVFENILRSRRRNV